jgi:hypothetical protein
MNVKWNNTIAKTVEDLLLSAYKGSEQIPPSHTEIVRLTGCLPMYLDIGGGILLTKEGELISYNYDTETTKPFVDSQWFIVAITSAVRRYPCLIDILPQRPEEALTCSDCSGSGIHRNVVCSSCLGLGWITNPSK